MKEEKDFRRVGVALGQGEDIEVVVLDIQVLQEGKERKSHIVSNLLLLAIANSYNAWIGATRRQNYVYKRLDGMCYIIAEWGHVR